MPDELAPLALAILAGGIVVSLISLNLYPKPQRSAPRIRFEFRAVDFALGCFFAALIASLSAGNSLAEMGLADRFLVSSKTSAALTAFSGLSLGVAFIALAGSIRLMGFARALIASVGLAVAVADCFSLPRWQSFVAIALFGFAAVLALLSSRATDAKPVLPNPAERRRPEPAKLRSSTKGILFSLTAAILLGLAGPIAIDGVAGDFGLGPYAGLLVLAAGAIIAVLPVAFILIHIEIDSTPAHASQWLRMPTRLHLYGLVGGCAAAFAIAAFLEARLSTAHQSTLAYRTASASFLLLPALWIRRDKPSLGFSATALLLFAGGLVFSNL